MERRERCGDGVVDVTRAAKVAARFNMYEKEKKRVIGTESGTIGGYGKPATAARRGRADEARANFRIIWRATLAAKISRRESFSARWRCKMRAYEGGIEKGTSAVGSDGMVAKGRPGGSSSIANVYSISAACFAGVSVVARVWFGASPPPPPCTKARSTKHEKKLDVSAVSARKQGAGGFFFRFPSSFRLVSV